MFSSAQPTEFIIIDLVSFWDHLPFEKPSTDPFAVCRQSWSWKIFNKTLHYKHILDQTQSITHPSSYFILSMRRFLIFVTVSSGKSFSFLHLWDKSGSLSSLLGLIGRHGDLIFLPQENRKSCLNFFCCVGLKSKELKKRLLEVLLIAPKMILYGNVLFLQKFQSNWRQRI